MGTSDTVALNSSADAGVDAGDIPFGYRSRRTVRRSALIVEKEASESAKMRIVSLPCLKRRVREVWVMSPLA